MSDETPQSHSWRRWADPLWVSQDSGVVPLGENLQVTFIFEIPNQAIQLVLEGPGRLRLGLGTAHHSNR